MARRRGLRELLTDVGLGAAKGYATGAQSDIPEVGLAHGFAGGFDTARGMAEQRRKAANIVRLKLSDIKPDIRPELDREIELPGDQLAPLLEKMNIPQTGLSFSQRESLLDKSLRAKKEIAEMKAKQGRPLPGGEADKFAQVGVLKDLLQDVKANYDPTFVGPVQARIGRASQTFGPGATTQKSNFYQNISAIRNQILNLRSGAAISAQEAARLIQELPQETRSDVDFYASMNNFEKTLNTILENKKRVFKATGYNVDEIDGGQKETEDDFSDIQQYLE